MSAFEKRLQDLQAELASVPAAMRDLPQWLVWRYVQKAPGAKPAKMPYYANGQLRGWPKGKPKDGKPTEAQPQAGQGDELDRAHLVSFDVALAAAAARPMWAGVGFAFLPDDGLIGIDVDHAIDRDTGEISELCALVLGLCPSYAELSVSGTGLHVIGLGNSDKFKDDLIGLEVYAGSQFFTVTGKAWAGHPLECRPITGFALQTMRALVEKSKKEQADAKAAERAAATPPAPVASAPAPTSNVRQLPAREGRKGEDFQRVNSAALANMGPWVLTLFPNARPYSNAQGGSGYRVASADVPSRTTQTEEELAIMSSGIQDFGTEEKLSAVDLVMRERRCGPAEALRWLADVLGVTISKPTRQRAAGGDGGGRRPEPPPEAAAGRHEAAGPGGRADSTEGDPRGDGADEPPHEGEGGDDGDGDAPADRKRKKVPQWKLDELFRDYAYQFGSDVVWCISRRESMKVSDLRHTYGGDAVKVWMGHAERRMVYKEQVVFEPGKELDEKFINLFAGLALTPAGEGTEAECQPMLDLLHWLCAQSEADGMDAKAVAAWVLKWIAMQLQQLGTKMQSALVFHGPQGTGKNLFFDVIRDYFGDYGVMVGQHELDDKFNTWLSGRMFIVGDEVVSRQEMYHSKNRLKWMISQDKKIPIRAMHQDVRFESNYVNLVFLSNEAQPLALEEGDRRFMVIHTPRKDYEGLYARVRAFLADGGAAKFLAYLLKVDLGDFEPGTVPPETRAKRELIELGYDASERFVHEWLTGYLELPLCVCTSEQLYSVYRRWADVAGEKWPGSQAQFTSKVKAFVQKRVEMGADGKPLEPALDYRVFTCPDSLKGRKSYRCWVPRGCGPRDDLVGKGDDPEGDEFKAYPTAGHWAKSCMDDFDKVARGFLRRPHQDGDAD